MTALRVKITESGRITARGLSSSQPGCATLVNAGGDTQDVVVDWEPYLNGDTISSISNSGSTATVTTKSSDTTSATLTIGGTSGRIRHQITSAGGIKKSVFIEVNGNSDFTDREYTSL